MSDWDPAANEIFLRAAERTAGDERAAYLDEACSGNANLRARVEELLAAHAAASHFLESPAAGVATALGQVARGEAAGETVGPYTLLQKLGEGGMGSVWSAEQHAPVRRRVALKLIKPGMDSHQVLRRFEAERQALALMDHPNIAKVFDAGTTTEGRPYFAMELVKGVPITRYCDELNLSVRERLDLFVPVCRAIQHAHTKGVVHRDVKPSNVLVAVQDGKAVPKVIDFGVAKALHQRLADRTMYTELGAVVGTLEYMAPEQAELSALDVDTRADVYALGVLLYELLTGSTPLDKKRLASAGLAELVRIIKEEDPPKPSTRLSESSETLPGLAAHRRTEPAKLARDVRGDLDWIVMKCLEKDRARRYETANALARDVERHLADEPIEARPPSRGYRLRKFARRHKSPVFAASLVLLALVFGVIGTTWGLIRAEQQRAIVERQRDELAERNKALQAARERERLLNERARQAIETVASDQAIDRLTRERELSPEQEDFLNKMIQYYGESVEEGAATDQERSRQAQAYQRIGRLNLVLGRSTASENAYRRAVALGRQLAAEFPTRPEFRFELASSHAELGKLLGDTRSRDAEAALDEALAILKQLAADFPGQQEFRQTLAGVYNNLGNLYYQTGRLNEAENAQTEALTIRKQLAVDFPAGRNIQRALAMSHNNLGWLFQSSNRLEKAELAYRDAVALQRQRLAEYPNKPEFRLELAKYLFNLGNVLRDTGRPDDAGTAHGEAVSIFKQLAADFPNRADLRQELIDRGLHEDRGVGDFGEEE